MARLDARLELRLDKYTYERLERRAAADHVTVAHLVRDAIARELADDDRCWREQLLEKGLGLRVPVPDDPAALVRDLDAHYEILENPAVCSSSASAGNRANHPARPPGD